MENNVTSKNPINTTLPEFNKEGIIHEELIHRVDLTREEIQFIVFVIIREMKRIDQFLLKNKFLDIKQANDIKERVELANKIMDNFSKIVQISSGNPEHLQQT